MNDVIINDAYMAALEELATLELQLDANSRFAINWKLPSAFPLATIITEAISRERARIAHARMFEKQPVDDAVSNQPEQP